MPRNPRRVRTKEMLRPSKIMTFAQVLNLRRDTFTTDNGWILIQRNDVIIARQQSGYSVEAMVSLPKREFDKMVRFYLTPQRIVKR